VVAFFVAGDDLEAATRLLQESLDLSRSVGNERGVAQVLAMLVMQDARSGRWEAATLSLEETVDIWRRLGDRVHLAFDLVWLAFAYGRMGRSAKARSAALEALDLFEQAENATGLGIALVDLAFLATWEGRHEDAIRLAAANEALRNRVGGPPAPIGGFMEGEPAVDARAHIPSDVADRAWEEGLHMDLDEAIAFARGERE
jgi:tetratricopeptide (TPR) repeat protein